VETISRYPAGLSIFSRRDVTSLEPLNLDLRIQTPCPGPEYETPFLFQLGEQAMGQTGSDHSKLPREFMLHRQGRFLILRIGLTHDCLPYPAMQAMERVP
jgi:hypothetical protein